MKMLDLLEKDKEKIINDLILAKTPDRAGAVLESELDKLLYSFNEECSSEEGREAAAFMLQTARTSAPLMDSIGEARVWERDGDISTPEKGLPKLSILFLILGICFSALAIFLGLDDRLGSLNILGEWTKFLALAIGVISMFLSGFFAGKPPKAKGEKIKKTELIIDANKIYRALRTVILAVDRNLDQVVADSESKGPDTKFVEESGVDGAQVELFSNLLEAAYSGDGDMALSKMEGVKYYLHKKGIEVMDYNEENAGFFDMIPSTEQGTIRPALLLNGEILKKGLATGGRG